MKNKILILGAGMVSVPLIRYLAERNFLLSVASKVFYHEERYQHFSNIQKFTIDINDSQRIIDLIRVNDIVVSLLPYTYHLQIANFCLEEGKDLVTASYISDEMWALDSLAKEKSLIFLNELGLDPGIDHISAQKLIDEIQGKGGHIESFKSNCGGLPAWDSVNNPLQYKLSWAPRAVLLAAKNQARFKRDNEIIEIPNQRLFKEIEKIELPQYGTYEVYQNRDSIKYIEIYHLESAKTFSRGTIRNIGWSELFSFFVENEILDEQHLYDSDKLMTKQIMAKHLKLDEKDPSSDLVSRGKLMPNSKIIEQMKWLGLFDETYLKKGQISSFEILLHAFETKMQYQSYERDLVILHHEFIYTINKKRNKLESYLVDLGEKNGDTSMAKTVGIPAAIGVELIADNLITSKGVLRPNHREIYPKAFERLEKAGIRFIERTSEIN